MSERELTLTYAEARPKIKTLDILLFKGPSKTQRLIRWYGAGFMLKVNNPYPDDFSHAAIVIRSTDEMERQRIRYIEANGRSGAEFEFLSDLSVRDHGEVYWLPVGASVKQRIIGKKEALRLSECKPRYDYAATIFAPIRPILLDVDKAVNCSELVWHIERKSGIVGPIINVFGRECAPSPGALPFHMKIQPIHITEING